MMKVMTLMEIPAGTMEVMGIDPFYQKIEPAHLIL